MNLTLTFHLSNNLSCSSYYHVKESLQFRKPRILNNAYKLLDESSKRGSTLKTNLSSKPHDHFSVIDKSYLIDTLSFCSQKGFLVFGKKIHSLAVRLGLVDDQFVSTSLVDMYAKCRDIDSAFTVFRLTSNADVASYNCLISGYSKNNLFDQAFSLFIRIQDMGLEANSYTYTSLLSICGNVAAVKEGKQFHGQIVKFQLLSEVAIGNALLSMYSKFGMMREAESLFSGLIVRNLISWTAIINGYYLNGEATLGLKLFCLMRESGVEPNEYALSIALSCCIQTKDFELGCAFHTLAIKREIALDNFVGTGIVDLYTEFDETCNAMKQLKEMEKESFVSAAWTAVLARLVHKEKAKEAMDIFNDMVKADALCDEFTYSIMLKACSAITSLESCKQIHARVVKSKFTKNGHVNSSVIEAYTKCGNFDDAEKAFCQISEPDLVSWNSLIKSYSQNGNPMKAVLLFQKMIEIGIRPTNTTFLAVISGCSHSCLVKEGMELYELMIREYNIAPEEEHQSCIVDLMGRSGKLENALEFIKNLPNKPTAKIWRPLLAACRSHKNMEMAEFVAKKIIELDPNDATVYVTLSNMYTELGNFLEAEKQRKLMTAMEVKKEPGCSWIEVNNKIYKFFSGDKTQSRAEDKLKELTRQVKEIGNGTNEDSGIYHSERLAISFGLISSTRKRIRIFKNLRVCLDCHSFMKVVSTMIEQEIVLRDNFRFHHFKQGFCSCGDYW